MTILFSLIVMIAVLVYAAYLKKKTKRDTERKEKEQLEMEKGFCSYSNGRLVLLKRDSMISQFVSIREHMYYSTKDNPTKVHYGSATVGGVTTGGVYTTGGGKSFNGQIPSGKWELVFTGYIPPVDNGANVIKDIKLSDELLEEAKASNICKYLSDWGTIIVVTKEKVFSSNTNIAFMEAQRMVNNVTSLETQRKLAAGYPSQAMCQEIYDWITGRA